MSDKTFKTYDELIDILTERGISISTPDERDYAKNILSQTGYYNLINGYSKLFLDYSTNSYKEGATLYEIHALYQFDRVLRDIFFNDCACLFGKRNTDITSNIAKTQH